MALGVGTRHLPSSGVCAPCQARAQVCDEQRAAGLGPRRPEEAEAAWVPFLRSLFCFSFKRLPSPDSPWSRCRRPRDRDCACLSFVSVLSSRRF